MDSTINIDAIAHVSQTTASALPMPEDDLAFFGGLWFLIPAALAIWSGLIWAVTRII